MGIHAFIPFMFSFFRCHKVKKLARDQNCLKNREKNVMMMLLKLCRKEWHCIFFPRILMFHIVCYTELLDVMVYTNLHLNVSLMKYFQKKKGTNCKLHQDCPMGFLKIISCI
jgi:hypothetical protein